MTLPATMRLNSRATTESYAAGFGPKNVASTATPNTLFRAAASLRSVFDGGVTHLTCVGSCWQVFSPGAVPEPPHAASADIASATRPAPLRQAPGRRRTALHITTPDGCPGPTDGSSRQPPAGASAFVPRRAPRRGSPAPRESRDARGDPVLSIQKCRG